MDMRACGMSCHYRFNAFSMSNSSSRNKLIPLMYNENLVIKTNGHSVNDPLSTLRVYLKIKAFGLAFVWNLVIFEMLEKLKHQKVPVKEIDHKNYKTLPKIPSKMDCKNPSFLIVQISAQF